MFALSLVAMLAVSALALVLASPVRAASVENGDFETGTLDGFTVVNQQESNGDWYAYSGTTAPLSERPITAPPQGDFAATTDQGGPGSHVLYQDIILEPNAEHTLSFTLYYRNEAEDFATPDTLDYNTRPNQQYRVDIVKPSANPFSVDPKDVLASVYQTEVGDSNTLEPTRTTFDLSPYAGQTVRLRFTETENQDFFRASVDDIAVDTELRTPDPDPDEPTNPQNPTNPNACTIKGTQGNDILRGTAGRDVICGLGGNDIIKGFGGNDLIRGGDGNDTISGDSGNDTIRGGSGKDTILGDTGSDRIFGEAGDDVLRGQEGNDLLSGGTGNDVLQGGPGRDTLRPGPGRDVSVQ
jgi:hypothetical protein